MRKFSKAVFTMMVIFGAAYMLAASGCAGSSGNDGANLAAPVNPNNNDGGGEDTTVLQPLNPNQVRECTNNEFAQLVSWRNAVNKANGEINTAKGKQSQGAVEASLAAIKACDSRFSYHKVEPCKKTKTTILNTEVKVYDAFLIKKDCSQVEGYLTKLNIRPKPGVTPAPVQPAPQPQQPLPVDPVQPPPVIDNPGSGTFSVCSQDEFSRLSEWSQAQDRANKSIAKLGNNWKYDEPAITNAALAVKQCESLMKYHAQRPCEKNIKQDDGSTIRRQYSRESLGERCNTSRKYFYEYVQNKTTLIFPNADLYIDLSQFHQQRFDAESWVTLGNCAVENKTGAVIDYTGRKALVVETRGFEADMAVFITAEGLKLDCYGVDLDGAFSKTEIVRILKAKDTNINLEYRLK